MDDPEELDGSEALDETDEQDCLEDPEELDGSEALDETDELD